MYLSLTPRGPVTGIGALVAVATFGAGTFFNRLRQTTIDCAFGSATDEGCAVDIIETVVSALIAIGATAGATAIGFTSPTPRELSSDAFQPIFRVDGQDVDWATAASSHLFGVDRSVDAPAMVEWQHNATSQINTYYTYSTDTHLILRHDTGMELPIGEKRSLCKAYVDVIIASDTLRSAQLAAQPKLADLDTLARTIFEYYANNKYDSGCVFLGTNDGVAGAKFELGAACSTSTPYPKDCSNAQFNTPLYLLTT